MVLLNSNGLKELPECNMDLKRTSSVLLLCLMGQVICHPHLSKEDVALLSAEKENPKCFTRTFEEFTCFWDAPAEKSYEFFYTIYNKKRCNLSQQNSEEGKVLHICFFPENDVISYILINLMVLETDTNITIYKRTVTIEDHVLPSRPSNVWLYLTGEAGQLLISWQPPILYFENKVEYEIRYSSKTDRLNTSSKLEYKLLYLDSAQMCTVQMRLKLNGNSLRSYWSDWSSPVTAKVPQRADDIKLECYTADLKQVQCRWDEGLYEYNNYSLHYRQASRTKGTWGSWKICDKHNITDIQCFLYGDKLTVFQGHIKAGLEPNNQTFYMDMFKMNRSIKTEAPQGLTEETKGGRVCLTWSCPLQLICKHLNYQVYYRLQTESECKIFTVPRTKTCIDVQVNSKYTIQVRAVPNGTFYGGHWSAWSKPHVVQLPSEMGLLFIVCVPLSLLIISAGFFFFFSGYVSKLKLFLWPPVPNLNEVLESFLKEIRGQNWEPNFSIKMCDDDIPASVVEIMSERQKKAVKASNITSQHGSLAGESDEEDVIEGLEGSREYVTLNTNNVLPCLTGNDYVYGVNASSGKDEEKLCCCSSVCSTTSTNILNHSYLQLEALSKTQSIITPTWRTQQKLQQNNCSHSEN